MVDEPGVAPHVAALLRVQDELLDELETAQGPQRYAELQPLVADVEWALSRCQTRTNERHAPPQQPRQIR
jgi:hypothetical protein